jgi:hypothetical protein
VVDDDGDAEVDDDVATVDDSPKEHGTGRSMEAVVDAPCGEIHAPSLYAAHGLLIILRMIMIKITWPQRAPVDVSDS